MSSSSALQEPYSPAQIRVWLRGLLTLAWADGQFDDQEKELIKVMTDSEFAPNLELSSLEPIEPDELAAELHLDPEAAQNFLRMAVMVALADGVYSQAEDEKLMAFCRALKLDSDVLESLQSTLCDLSADSSDDLSPEPSPDTSAAPPSSAKSSLQPPDQSGVDPLKPAREWLDQLEVSDPRLARFVCKLVPSQCPFERDVKLFGKKIVHIPPMCKINPLYEQLVGLRFRALSYLADDRGEDVSAYL
ncbi:TerB family tellurite resistance protein [Romeria aff. gracilis LEGE 07310]|uniref:TerB family tellurite resistance protein n=1 Tax=Vasconcelosia minhoensis LEGE 07310 TaxID=915328 RepID=A0A8J7AFT3_9CYAN|nr:Mo-dependent nitrogenase C-terminal domain-containing protein [Romeria gracilis]MBE9078446.1 TerB family tellurite resistance protein [Romeria aff. gracilis LEGE 07310]